MGLRRGCTARRGVHGGAELLLPVPYGSQGVNEEKGKKWGREHCSFCTPVTSFLSQEPTSRQCLPLVQLRQWHPMLWSHVEGRTSDAGKLLQS